MTSFIQELYKELLMGVPEIVFQPAKIASAQNPQKIFSPAGKRVPGQNPQKLFSPAGKRFRGQNPQKLFSPAGKRFQGHPSKAPYTASYKALIKLVN